LANKQIKPRKPLGDIPLKDRFPRLFSISIQKEASVAEIWDPVSDEIGNFCGVGDYLFGRKML
jgi:hypothetical protein